VRGPHDRPDLGAPSCTVDLQRDQRRPSRPQIAVPKLTASYSGDTVYDASQGAPTLGCTDRQVRRRPRPGGGPSRRWCSRGGASRESSSPRSRAAIGGAPGTSGALPGARAGRIWSRPGSQAQALAVRRSGRRRPTSRRQQRKILQDLQDAINRLIRAVCSRRCKQAQARHRCAATADPAVAQQTRSTTARAARAAVVAGRPRRASLRQQQQNPRSRSTTRSTTRSTATRALLQQAAAAGPGEHRPRSSRRSLQDLNDAIAKAQSSAAGRRPPGGGSAGADGSSSGGVGRATGSRWRRLGGRFPFPLLVEVASSSRHRCDANRPALPDGGSPTAWVTTVGARLEQRSCC